MSDLIAISFPADLTRVVTLMYSRLYERAKTPSDLPWYREEPQDLLAEIGKTRERPGGALDVGCGSGMHAVWLAQQGWEVTGVDFTDRALEMARERSQAAPRCGGRLRLIAVIDAPAVVQRILRHLELLTEIPKARPTHASPTDVAPDLLFVYDPA